MPLPYNETELLLRIAEGDKAAFKELHDHYWNNLYSVALSFLKSPDWAMDVIQEVFLKLWERRHKLSEIDHFKPYLFVSTRNELLTALKSSTRQAQLQEKYAQRMPDHFMLPDQVLSVKELEGLVASVVAQLPELQRTIYRLTREQGLSHDEIAGQLGIARKTVANNMTKALNQIREYLQVHSDDLSVLLLIALECWL
jgi:RNA polymerase sigma-70 factor (ECF subfamily)